MTLKETEKTWNDLGRIDPLWSILTVPGKKGNKWDLEGFLRTGTEQIQSAMAHIESLGIPLRRGRAMDFGCGAGRLSQALSPYFDEVCGVDIAASMIELATKHNRYGDRCKYYLNQAEDLSVFATASFDFICSFITLQHMEPRYARSYIKEFLRLLVPGGVLLFQLPAEPCSLIAKIKTIIKRHCPPVVGLFRFYRRLRDGRPWIIQMYGVERDEVTKLIEETGGTVVDVRQDNAAAGFVSFCYCAVKS